jgi:hypothetical protein
LSFITLRTSSIVCWAVDLQRGRETGRDKEVRALLFDQELEQLVNEACCAFAFHRVISCLSRAWIGYAGA